jgi:hypothetical protein
VTALTQRKAPEASAAVDCAEMLQNRAPLNRKQPKAPPCKRPSAMPPSDEFHPRLQLGAGGNPSQSEREVLGRDQVVAEAERALERVNGQPLLVEVA